MLSIPLRRRLLVLIALLTSASCSPSRPAAPHAAPPQDLGVAGDVGVPRDLGIPADAVTPSDGLQVAFPDLQAPPTAPPDLALAVSDLAVPVGAIPILVDGTGGGRVFDGIGAVSGGGGNSRLLIDYSEPYRSQILDYLFKPGFGAALQIFKVEIGGDMNSTDGAEPSHMHSASDERYDRGYEWWLMEEAKKRNPKIKLVALSWGAPGWIGSGNFWSDDMIQYIVKWISHAQSDHNLTIDYIGGKNESDPYPTQWFIKLKSALANAGLATKIIGWDSGWSVADSMVSDPAFNAAVDVVGVHYPCGNGDGDPADVCDTTTANARSLNKPLWASEHGSQDSNDGAAAMARAINRDYIDGSLTAFINWPLVAALPPYLPFPTTGLVVADQPWSGSYSVGKSVWVLAHTTQFVDPGWIYIDSAMGYLGGARANGSYVTLKAPDRSSYAMIVETSRALAPQTILVTLAGGLPTGPVHVWETDLSSAGADSFVSGADLVPVDGKFWITLQPGHLYTLSSRSGAAKGTTTIPPRADFSPSYSDDFESYAVGHEAKYLADQEGSFEVVACGGVGRTGQCLRQMAPTAPIYWHSHSGYPYAILGDRLWSNYSVGADIMFEEAGSAELIGRFSARDYWEIGHINAYYLKVSNTGGWAILKNTTAGTLTTLASGSVPALGINQWHTVAFGLQGTTLTATIDGTQVGSADDPDYTFGPAGIAVGADDLSWSNVQLDNFQIVPGKALPKYTIVNRNSGKLLAVAGSSTVDGAMIVQSSALTSGDASSQQWRLSSGASYTLLVNVASGKALDVPALSTTHGTQLIQWAPNGGPNQQWKLTQAGGYYTIINRNSNLVADVNAASTDDGAAVIQWDPTGGANQQWVIQPVP
jgi:hypothetical protein